MKVRQPSNVELKEALDVASWARFAFLKGRKDEFAKLKALRGQRTSWYGSTENELRVKIDKFLDAQW